MVDTSRWGKQQWHQRNWNIKNGGRVVTDQDRAGLTSITCYLYLFSTVTLPTLQVIQVCRKETQA